MTAKTQSLVEQFQEELRTIANGDEPHQKAEKRDHIIDDVISDYLKKFFWVLQWRIATMNTVTARGNKLLEHIAAMEGENNNLRDYVRNLFKQRDPADAALYEEVASIAEELPLMSEELDALSALFWVEVRRRHPLLRDKRSIGIRKGWKLCWSEDHVQHISLSDLSDEDRARLKKALQKHFGVKDVPTQH